MEMERLALLLQGVRKMMIPESLIKHLIDEEAGVWPEWLPPIIESIDVEGELELWGSDVHEGLICDSNSEFEDPFENTENLRLIAMCSDTGIKVVKLWGLMGGLKIPTHIVDNFPQMELSTEQNPKQAIDSLRKILLKNIFHNEEITDDNIRAYLDNFPQENRYPIIGEISDTKELILIPEPEDYWNYARLNITPTGGKIWIPTHAKMKNSQSGIGTIPPNSQSECVGWPENRSNIWSYLEIDEQFPLSYRRDKSSGPNVIFWEENENYSALVKVQSYLRGDNTDCLFPNNRKPIRLGLEDDAEIKIINLLAASEELREEVNRTEAFKVPSILHITYHPINSMIVDGYEDESGIRPHQTYATDTTVNRENYSFYYQYNNNVAKTGNFAKWHKHIFNWPEEGDLHTEYGRSGQNVWEKIFAAEGKTDKFNYNVLVRDIRLDYLMFELAHLSNENLALALSLSANSQEMIRGKVSIFEGYWSKETGHCRRLTFDTVPFVAGTAVKRKVRKEFRVSSTHPDFKMFREIEGRLIVGFTKYATDTARRGNLFEQLKEPEIVISQLLNPNWIPYFDSVDRAILEEITTDPLHLIHFPPNNKMFEHYVIKDSLNPTHPWKEKIGMICSLISNCKNEKISVLYSILDKLLSILHESPQIVREVKKILGKKISEENAVRYPNLAKSYGDTTVSLSEINQGVLQKINNDSTISVDDLIKTYSGIGLNNWRYNSEEHCFHPSQELGLEREDLRIHVISPENAATLFGFDANQHHSNSEDKGVKNSYLFGVKSDIELVILHAKICNKLSESENIEQIDPPIMERVSLAGLNFDNQNHTHSRYNFLKVISSLNKIRELVDDGEDVYDIISNVVNENSFSIITSSKAKELGLETQSPLVVGTGGWLSHEQDGKLYLIRGDNPLDNSLNLLKKLLIISSAKTDILEIPTRNPFKNNKYKIKDLFGALDSSSAELIANQFCDTISEIEGFELLNPWNANEKQEYNRKYTLTESSAKLEQSEVNWMTSEKALERIEHLKQAFADYFTSGKNPSGQQRDLLELMYDGRPCILDGHAPSITNADILDLAQLYPRHKISISNKMLSREFSEGIEGKLDQHNILLGDNLIVSGATEEKFNRTADNDRWDLRDDFVDVLSSTINSVQWDNTAAQKFVLVKDILISPSGEYRGLHLHKLHLLHIAGLYSALQEVIYNAR
jgi:hypothetical protein